MPRFEKYRDAHALAEISRKLKSGELLCEKQEENIHHHVETNREPLPGKQSQGQSVSSETEGGDPSSPEDDLAQHQQQHSPDESSSDSSSPSASSSPSPSSSSEEREEEEREGSDIEQQQQQHDEFIDDDVMAMLETHAEKEKNDINACLYAIDYVLSRS